LIDVDVCCVNKTKFNTECFFDVEDFASILIKEESYYALVVHSKKIDEWNARSLVSSEKLQGCKPSIPANGPPGKFVVIESVTQRRKNAPKEANCNIFELSVRSIVYRKQ